MKAMMAFGATLAATITGPFAEAQGLRQTPEDQFPAPSILAPIAVDKPISWREKLSAPRKQKGESCVGFAVSYMYAFANNCEPPSPYYLYHWGALQVTDSDGNPLRDKNGNHVIGDFGCEYPAVIHALGTHGVCSIEDHPATFVGKKLTQLKKGLWAKSKAAIRYQYIPIPLEESDRVNQMIAELKGGKVLLCGFRYYQNFRDIKASGDRFGFTKMKRRANGNSVPVWTTGAGQVATGLHAMLVAGYDPDIKAFEVLNSHGQEFGDKGYIWIDEKFIADTGSKAGPLDNPCCVYAFSWAKVDAAKYLQEIPPPNLPQAIGGQPLATLDGEGWVRLASPKDVGQAFTADDFNFTLPDQVPIASLDTIKPDTTLEVKVGIDQLNVRSEAVLLGTGGNTTSAPPLAFLASRNRFRISNIRKILTFDSAKHEYWVKGACVD